MRPVSGTSISTCSDVLPHCWRVPGQLPAAREWQENVPPLGRVRATLD